MQHFLPISRFNWTYCGKNKILSFPKYFVNRKISFDMEQTRNGNFKNGGFCGNYSHFNGFINWSHLWRESVEVKRSFNSCFRFHREMCLMLKPHSVSYLFSSGAQNSMLDDTLILWARYIPHLKCIHVEEWQQGFLINFALIFTLEREQRSNIVILWLIFSNSRTPFNIFYNLRAGFCFGPPMFLGKPLTP